VKGFFPDSELEMFTQRHKGPTIEFIAEFSSARGNCRAINSGGLSGGITRVEQKGESPKVASRGEQSDGLGGRKKN